MRCTGHTSGPGRPGRARITPLIVGVAVSSIGITTGCGTDDTPSLTVFAASSLGDVMDELGDRFEAETGVRVEVSIGGSSSLRLQLDEGATADVFAPADARQIDLLDAAFDGAPTVVATTRLVVAYPTDATAISLDRFDDADLLLGACAPQVPCGGYAAAALAAAGVDAALDTEEPDVRSVAAKVADGELDAGLVYATDVRADDRLAAADIEPTVVVSYPVVRLADSDHAENADRFIEFLGGWSAREVFADAGFDEP